MSDQQVITTFFNSVLSYEFTSAFAPDLKVHSPHLVIFRQNK